MNELPQVIPDHLMLLALAPEELAAKILFLLRERGTSTFQPLSVQREMWQFSSIASNQPQYPRQYKEQIDLAVAEAWAWLHAQGLIVPKGDNGWYALSRRAKSMENESDFANFRTARLLSRDVLHPRIAEGVWLAFMRGEYDVAVFLSVKAVEVYAREASGLGNEFVGIRLMREAFKPEGGILTDRYAEAGERQGRMELFSGAIASFKNPQSHREVNLNEPAEALEIIFLANHLLRIVEARMKAITSKAKV